MKSKMLFILLFIAITGCQYNSQKSKIGDLPVIDISKKYPEKKYTFKISRMLNMSHWKRLMMFY